MAVDCYCDDWGIRDTGLPEGTGVGGGHEYGIWGLGPEFIGVEELVANHFAGSDAYQRAGFGSCGAFRALRFFLHGRDFHYHSLALEGSDEILLGCIDILSFDILD